VTIPAVIAGVAIVLWLTRTTLNIQSFMGVIMATGVAVANAILLVTFAERSRAEGREPSEAAIEGPMFALISAISEGRSSARGYKRPRNGE
jgi:multidrug efflux pump subunit AcrB